jgi:flagella basal body P-ring formation protein FlgA
MYSNNESLRNILLVIYTFLFPLELWAALPQKAVEIKLRAQPLVVEDAVRLVDVAEIYAKNLAQFESLSQLVVAQFPADKNNLRVPGSYVRARIKEVLGENTDFNLEIPEWLEINKPVSRITDLRLADEIEKLAKSEAKIPTGIEAKISFLQIPKEIFLKDAKTFHISAANINGAWRGETTFKLEIGDGKIYWIRTNIRWFAQRWVAKRDIRAWEGISESDFEYRNIEVTNLQGDALMESTQEELHQALEGARTKRFIAANSILQKNQYERRPDVVAGTPVKVTFVAESGLRIQADGAMIASGHALRLLLHRLLGFLVVEI